MQVVKKTVRNVEAICEASQFKATDYNGYSFDGFPFVDEYPWIVSLFKCGDLIIDSRGQKERDYGVLILISRRVSHEDSFPTTKEEQVVIEPGMWLVRSATGAGAHTYQVLSDDEFKNTYVKYAESASYAASAAQQRIQELEASLDEAIRREMDIRDRYRREVLGENNEGDPIGGPPAYGLKHMAEGVQRFRDEFKAICDKYCIEPADLTFASMLDTFERALSTASHHNRFEDFKMLVHSSLDQMGVPTFSHDAPDCRVGARLNWLRKAISEDLLKQPGKSIQPADEFPVAGSMGEQVPDGSWTLDKAAKHISPGSVELRTVNNDTLVLVDNRPLAMLQRVEVEITANNPLGVVKLIAAADDGKPFSISAPYPKVKLAGIAMQIVPVSPHYMKSFHENAGDKSATPFDNPTPNSTGQSLTLGQIMKAEIMGAEIAKDISTDAKCGVRNEKL